LSSSDCCRQYFAVGSPNTPSLLAGDAIADDVDGGLPDVLAAARLVTPPPSMTSPNHQRNHWLNHTPLQDRHWKCRWKRPAQRCAPR
jgi:hypothetical protein